MITFKSQATANLMMLSPHAEALVSRFGKTVSEPGILEVKDMSTALKALHDLEDHEAALAAARQAGESVDEAEDEPRPVRFQDEPVSLKQRAAPLIRMIEQAQAEGKPIVWGV